MQDEDIPRGLSRTAYRRFMKVFMVFIAIAFIVFAYAILNDPIIPAIVRHYKAIFP